MKKAILFVPFWGQEGHIGNLRVDRFRRWLISDDYYVVIIKAGITGKINKTPWGVEITVKDPLGLYKDKKDNDNLTTHRKPNKLRRKLAYLLFNPDPGIVWSRLAAANSIVYEYVNDADFIMSSNPPESSHIGAWRLATRCGIPHIVDMRDGWLDEPLKPILRKSRIRRWLEARIERKILLNSVAIMVSSDVWKELLCNRIKDVRHKITTLTNGYPVTDKKYKFQSDYPETKNELLLVHGGKFTGSDPRRSPVALLEPLLSEIVGSDTVGAIKLIGSLSNDERQIINKYKDRFKENGWRIDCPGPLLRDELIELFYKANGLLLLSVTYAQIPGKLFEYIPAGRPIFVVTQSNSATWRVCEKLPQAFLLDLTKKKNISLTHDFISAAKQKTPIYEVPSQYSEEFLSKVMLDVISQAI